MMRGQSSSRPRTPASASAMAAAGHPPQQQQEEEKEEEEKERLFLAPQSDPLMLSGN